MTKKRVVMGLVLLLSVLPMCSAFPLSGGNGIFNATVYGVSSVTPEGLISSATHERSSVLSVDMSVSPFDKGRNDNCLVELVDSDDRAYSDGSGDNFGGWGVRYNDSVRGTLDFFVPIGIVIKRLKITPNDSDPFSIDWNGVPKTSADGITMSFYSSHVESRGDSQYQQNEHVFERTFDIKLTNTANTTLAFSEKEFAFKDNNGWVYYAIYDPNNRKLAPNESLRFTITFDDVGEFARPSEIIFRNVSMDIGAWT